MPGWSVDDTFYQAVLEQSVALVGVGDADDIRFLTPSVGRALGWGASGMPGPAVLSDGIVHVEDRERLARVLDESAQSGGPVGTQVRLRHRDGRSVTLDCVVHDLRDDARVGGFLMQAWDVSEREAAFQRAALYDQLTGLPNRVLFGDRLARALRAQQRHPRKVGVIYADLDGFKQLNDEHGHRAGDAVLVEVARRLAQAVRPGDTAARLSGDEFVVLCEELTDLKAGYDVARRIAAALEPPVAVQGVPVQVGASLGVAVADDPLIAPDDLLAAADRDMYRVKRRKDPVPGGLLGVLARDLDESPPG